MQVNVVLLAGGRGVRLWPLSNDVQPKQFIKLPKYNLSSFQLALLKSLKITPPVNIIITANQDMEALVKQQIAEVGASPLEFQILFESSNNNTGEAVYNTCIYLEQKQNDSLTYFFPVDHLLFEESDYFLKILDNTDIDKINIFGQLDVSVCNKFGYITLGETISQYYHKVEYFIEKPEGVDVRGDLYRNLGIYLARPSVLLEEFYELHVDLCNLFEKKLSLDKIISESSKKLNVHIVDFNWYDIGSIEDLYEYCGDAYFEECKIEKNDVSRFNQEAKEFQIECKEDAFRILKKMQSSEKSSAL